MDAIETIRAGEHKTHGDQGQEKNRDCSESGKHLKNPVK
jgi:hypothetical protein